MEIMKAHHQSSKPQEDLEQDLTRLSASRQISRRRSYADTY